jgi:CheY-like chemotaxis protein
MKSPKNKRLLVVDDDDDIRESLSDLLQTEGYEVATARQGLDALTQLRKGLLPSLILLDLMMPQMNGWEFLEARSADAALAGLPVVVLSADTKPLATDAAVCGRLAKPFKIAELLAIVERCAT